MECKKNTGCNGQDKRELERELEMMSPFEIKNRLISMAQEDARRSSDTFLNAGRGNPNWVATTPREAFFLLGKWALAECHRTKDAGNGIVGIPSREGSGERFRTFLEVHRNADGGQLLRDAFEYLIVTSMLSLRYASTSAASSQITGLISRLLIFASTASVFLASCVSAISKVLSSYVTTAFLFSPSASIATV